MAALILPNRLVRQPQGALRVDRSNPLGKKVLSAFLGLRNVVTGHNATVSGAYARETAPQGAVNSFDGSSYLNLGPAARSPDFNEPVTIAYFSRANAPPAYPGVLRIAPPSGSGYDFCILRSSSDARYSFAVGYAQEGLPNFSSTPLAAGGVAERVVVACVAGLISGHPSRYGLWINRTRYTGASTTPFGGQATIGSSYLGWDGADSKFAGLLDELVIFRGVLNDGEIAGYYDNPWQLFAAPSRRMWVPEGALTPPPVGTLGEFDPGLRIAGWW